MANKIYSLVFTSGDPRNQTGLTPTLVLFYRLTDGQTLAAPGITQVLANTGIFSFEYQPTIPIAFLADGGVSAGSARYLPGNLDPIQWIDHVATTLTAIGTTNFALGTTAVAIGTTNFAIGTTNFALGTTSVAIGTTNFALGTTAVAIGTTLTGYGVSIYAATETLIAMGTTTIGLGNSILAQLGTTNSAIGSTNTDPADVMGMLKRIQEWHEGTSEFAKTSGIWQVKTRGSTLISQRTLNNTVTQVTKT